MLNVGYSIADSNIIERFYPLSTCFFYLFMLSTYILLENIERNIEYRLVIKMYSYAEADSIFYGVSNIYLFSIVTAFLAVIIALYYSNFLKDENVRI